MPAHTADVLTNPMINVQRLPNVQHCPFEEKEINPSSRLRVAKRLKPFSFRCRTILHHAFHYTPSCPKCQVKSLGQLTLRNPRDGYGLFPTTKICGATLGRPDARVLGVGGGGKVTVWRKGHVAVQPQWHGCNTCCPKATTKM